MIINHYTKEYHVSFLEQQNAPSTCYTFYGDISSILPAMQSVN